MENKSGNGYTSPFGDEKGATLSGGASTGAHDFIEQPESDAPKTGGRDFTKESRSQQMTADSGYNKDSVPSGGDSVLPDVTEADCGGTMGVTSKPYSVGG